MSTNPITSANAPVDGVGYLCNGNFSATTNSTINGARTVYMGAASYAVIQGLTAGTTYYMAVYEYNGVQASTRNYLTSAPAMATASTLAPRLEGDAPALALSAYPNPFNSAVTVVPSQTGMLHVYDLSGRIIQSVNVEGGLPLQVGETLAPGIYVVRNGTETLRIVKGN
jgi:hypothetical protein